MRYGKVLFFVILAFACFEIHAQTPKQVRILNNYGEIPFEDGKTIIAEIVFAGLDASFVQSDETDEMALTETDVLKHLGYRQATINAGEEFRGSKVAKAVREIREWLAERGYNRAEVVAFGEKLPKNQMKLIFAISRGGLARVSEIRFEGNENVKSEELVEDFKQCLGDSWKIYNARKYQFIASKCSLRFVFSKGYFQAKILEPKLQLISGSYIVTINVNEGARFHYGKVKVQGASAFTEDEILEFLEIKTGEVANGKTLQEYVYEKLKRIYGDKGYILYDAEFEPTFNQPQKQGDDATVDLLITIDEGRQFRLRKFEFIGVEKEKADELRKLFDLADGDIYRQNKMEEGVKKINERNEFYPVDKDQDVEIRTTEDSGEVYLVVKLRKIQ